MERNVDRLTRLLRDVLDSARVQSGRLRIDPRPLDLAHLARDTVAEYQVVARDHGVEMDVEAAPELWVQGDAARLHEVLMNLLSNAVKFTPRGGQVTVRVEPGPRAVRVEVQDTGIGLREGDVAQLFQPFAQVGGMELPHEAASSGSGLGLYIAQGIVQGHGGRIWASSPGPGQGSTFAFEVPVGAARGDGELPLLTAQPSGKPA